MSGLTLEGRIFHVLLFFLSCVVCKKNLWASQNHLHDLAQEAASIKTIDQRIGKHNLLYLEMWEEKKKLELEKKNIENQHTKIQERLSQFINDLVKLSDDFHLIRPLGPRELIEKSILEDKIEQKKIEISKAMKQSHSLESLLESLKNQVNQIDENIVASYQKISTLEDEKSHKAKNYIELKKKFNQDLELKKKEEALSLASKELKASQKKSLLTPVSSYKEYSVSKKGVKFIGDDSTLLKASMKGKVAYLGTLSSYGEVLIIDHGDNLKTVYLGHLHFKVLSGDEVKEGQVLGHLKSPHGANKIYFEYRKNNIALEPKTWLKKFHL